MLKKNDLFTATIEDLNNLGYGVCRIENLVVFVSGALPGDEVRLRIIKVAKTYAVARLEELLSPSPHRVESPCASFARCGGCNYLHLADAEELKLKEHFVRTEAKKAGLDLTVRPILSAPRREGYRNKAQYPLYKDRDGHIRFGFYARHTHTPVSAEGCVLQPECFSRIAASFCRAFEKAGLSCYDEVSGQGLLRHLNLRWDTKGQVLAEIVLCAKRAEGLRPIAESLLQEHAELFGVLANFNPENTNVIRGKDSELLCGESTLCQQIGDKTFFHGPASFFQVNTEAAEILFGEAKRLLNAKEDESVCDLYCGVGAVAQCIAPKSRIHGADVVREAIRFAEVNAKENGCDAAYVAMDAADYFAAAGKFDAVLLDPPRAGLSARMTELLLEKRPQKILYISCNPQTLCRDLALLCESAYTADGITPVDLFPKTGHVECVACLKRRSP